MAWQAFQLDPAAGGVSQATFDAHTHSYRKITRIGGDNDDKWASPSWADIVDDADTHAAESVDLFSCQVRGGGEKRLIFWFSGKFIGGGNAIHDGPDNGVFYNISNPFTKHINFKVEFFQAINVLLFCLHM